jgi:formamidopyrimidine-DNA glycosylase
MPEMPELEVVQRTLGPRMVGRVVDDVVVSARLGFLLRTPAQGLGAALRGRSVSRLWRRGKFLVLDVDSARLVMNPMLGGRVQWTPAAEKVGAATVFRLRLEGGDEFRFTDTARMGRVYLVEGDGLDTVPGWADLGPEAIDISADDFVKRIRRHPGELKNLLRKQEFIAGIGNAYSDEILHHAQLLPLRKRSTLNADDILRLHGSVQHVLNAAVEAISAQPHYETHKQDRSFMAVHMKGGQDCPRCGHRISEITARGEITNFCRGCQF